MTVEIRPTVRVYLRSIEYRLRVAFASRGSTFVSPGRKGADDERVWRLIDGERELAAWRDPAELVPVARAVGALGRSEYFCDEYVSAFAKRRADRRRRARLVE